MLFRLILCGLGLLAFGASAEDRVALVIGNSDYEVGRLTNPVNDAEDVATALRSLDFEVLLAKNLDRAGMLDQVDAFARKIRPGGLALFYFAGHGVEMNGQNWLMPVHNEQIGTQAQVRIHSVAAADVLQAMEERGARLNLLVLDACRNNPLPSGARSAQRGLGAMAVGTSTLVAYSTSPGNTAADGDGRNSPYTRALLQALKGDNVAIPDLFSRAGAAVRDTTGGAQVPWTSNTPIWPSVMLTARKPVVEPSPTVPAGGGKLTAADVESSQDDTGALGRTREEAEAGDASAMVKLGYMYLRAEGVSENRTEAIRWFRKAAEAGDAHGMWAVGLTSATGQIISRDGMRWIHKAAEAGSTDAMSFIGQSTMLSEPKDYAASIRWFRRGAEAGDSNAMMMLAQMYKFGWGVSQNWAEAARWYGKSAEAGNTNSMGTLGGLYKEGLGVEQNDAKAIYWYRKSADKDDPLGMYGLSEMYREGRGVSKDDAEAARWLRKVEERNQILRRGRG